MNDNDLLDLVEREIATRENGDGNRFRVQRNNIQHEGNWTYILVLPEPEDMWASKYSQLTGEVENAVYKQTKKRLVLIPAMPD